MQKLSKEYRTKVLIISNSQTDIRSITTAIKPFGVITIEDPSVRLPFLEQPSEIGVIIVDLDFKEREWTSLIKSLKSDTTTKSFRLIVLSREQDLTSESKALKLGADDFLRRPLTTINIVRVLALHFDKLKRAKFEKESVDKQTIFDTLFNQAPIGVVMHLRGESFDKTKRGNINVNPAFEKIVGYNAKEIKDLGWGNYTYEEDLQKERPLFEALYKGEITHYELEKRFIHKDGSLIWVQVTVASILLSSTNLVNYVFLVQNIQKRKILEESLKEKERNQRALLSNLPGMVFRCKNDERLTLTYASEGCLELTGYTSGELIEGKHIDYFDIVAPENRDLLFKNLKDQLATKASYRLEYEIITASKKRKWVLDLGRLIEEPDGSEGFIEGIALDFTRTKELEGRLQYQKMHDSLTQLPNRQALEIRLQRDSEERLEGARALMSINFSPLYLAGIRFGHLYVLEIIKQVATILSTFVNERRDVYGVFDNRFMLYITSYTDKMELEELGNEIIEQINRVLRFERISWGIGVIEIDWSTTISSSDLLKHVLIASEDAIDFESKTSNMRFYDKAMSEKVDKEAHLLVELTQISMGIDSSRLSLVFQPIVDMRSNKIVASEALARFNSSRYGNIPPLEFIPIAEKYKLIIPLGWIIISQAIEFSKKLHHSGHSDIMVSINISAYQLLEEQFVQTLHLLVKENGVKPSLFILEITETGVNSTYLQINQILGELQKLGFKIAIDDFGVGYSTFARSSELHIDFLKIDRLFVDKILTHNPKQSVLPDIISMAHKLGRKTVIEGVEHEQQRDYLQSIESDMCQGYLFGKPMREKELLEVLEKGTPVA